MPSIVYNTFNSVEANEELKPLTQSPEQLWHKQRALMIKPVQEEIVSQMKSGTHFARDCHKEVNFYHLFEENLQWKTGNVQDNLW